MNMISLLYLLMILHLSSHNLIGADELAGISAQEIIQARSCVIGYEGEIKRVVADKSRHTLVTHVSDKNSTLLATYDDDKKLLIIYTARFLYIHIASKDVDVFLDDKELLSNALEYKDNNLLPQDTKKKI